MSSLRLPQDLENRLKTLSQETHRTKTYYMTCALESFLDEYEEALLAASRWERVKRGESNLISFDEIEKELGLNDD